MISKTEVTTLADDDVIQTLDTDNLARFTQPFGDRNILITRSRITRWVVVYEDQTSGQVRYGCPKDIPWMHQAGCHGANRAGSHAHKPILAIQVQHQKGFHWHLSQALE